MLGLAVPLSPSQLQSRQAWDQGLPLPIILCMYVHATYCSLQQGNRRLAIMVKEINST